MPKTPKKPVAKLVFKPVAKPAKKPSRTTALPVVAIDQPQGRSPAAHVTPLPQNIWS